jgi:hypothetical protein
VLAECEAGVREEVADRGSDRDALAAENERKEKGNNRRRAKSNDRSRKVRESHLYVAEINGRLG